MTVLARRGTGLLLAALAAVAAAGEPPAGMAFIDAEIAAHPGASGAFVLERGEDALLARAWLVDHAARSIEVQYFIWSTDNVGILASEALLRAADRGVRVRVIVDDLLIDAPDESLLALAKHPNVEIRIYNPQHQVGTPFYKRLLNVVTDFRGVNQRMHDKTFVVDGRVGITGGRNMADEYFDYDHAYNFRDREALVLGPVVAGMQASFERFWASPLAAPVESLYDGIGVMQKHVTVNEAAVQRVYREIHAYAAAPENFAPEVHAAIEALPGAFPAIASAATWGDVEFLSDQPGKNDNRFALGGGGSTTRALAGLLSGARTEVLVQSPYLVMSDAALDLFASLRRRGVRVRISTNSLAATDNLQAFSGYRSQRERLVGMGLEIFEYRPDPAVRREVMRRYEALRVEDPVFALHAKTLVVDRGVVFIGTFNLDPRSENLNTEAGVVIHDPRQAAAVAASIETDMAPGNSWNAATDNPDQFAPAAKRREVFLWRLLPIRPLL